MPQPVSPVVPGLEPYEIIFGENQPGVLPLPTLRSKGPEYTVYSRWKLSDSEREALLKGADIYVFQQTFAHPFQPTALLVSHVDANEQAKAAILQALGLDEELNERLRIVLDKSFEP